MMISGLVSVIMPAYNSEKFIEESIRSVQHQSYPNWELIVVDDASNDETWDKVKQLSEGDSRITLLQNTTNQGTGISRNLGIKNARGEFIAFLDSDDVWKPAKLEIQLNFMEENNLKVCFSSYERITESGESLNEIVEALPFLTYQKLLKSNYIGNLTGIYNAKEIGKIYSPEIRKRQDWGLWLAAVKNGGTAMGIQKPLASYRVRRNSVSGNKVGMLKYNFNIYYKVLGFGILKSFRCMLIFLKEHFFIKNRQIKN